MKQMLAQLASLEIVNDEFKSLQGLIKIFYTSRRCP